jgi:hypothetical protein
MEYKYVGEGAGVPGLPHQISDEEAEALGVTELLKAAVENGSYVAQEAVSDPQDAFGSQPSAGDEESVSDQLSEQPPADDAQAKEE